MKNLTIILTFILLCSLSTIADRIEISNVQTGAQNIRKAKLSITNINGEMISDIDTNDFKIIENGEILKSFKIDCNSKIENDKVSAILAIDVSGSMQGYGIEAAKQAAYSWVEGMPEGSECGIISFCHYTTIVNDFTSNRSILNFKISGLYPEGGTDYNEPFIGSKGAINKLSAAKNKVKAIIFLTDGAPQTATQVDKIINYANANGINVFTITLGFLMPFQLKQIANETGGKWFDNVTTIEDTKQAFKDIMMSITSKSCLVYWQGKSLCGNGEIEYLKSNIKASYKFEPNKASGPKVLLKEKYIFTGQMKDNYTRDSSITITAINDSITIFAIIPDSTELKLKDDYDFPFTLKKDSSIIVKFRYKPTMGNYNAANITIKTNLCSDEAAFVWRSSPDPIVTPQIRNGFGVISILTELNLSNNLQYNGYHYGGGLQIFLSKRTALRMTFGIESEEVFISRNDISKTFVKNIYASLSGRFNILSNKNVSGYLMPIVKYSQSVDGTQWVDDYEFSIKNKTIAGGLILGAEFFPLHNVGVAGEYNAFASFSYKDDYIAAHKAVSNSIFKYKGISINSNFRFLVNYYIH